MSLALFGSSQSSSFQCEYNNADWSIFGKVYWCNVQNAVNITTLDAAQIDSITGTHLAGYNNDNVEAIQVYNRGQIHYFPRGVNNFFKNLKGIRIESSGLKELHQSDLKGYPKLMVLWLYGNNLEILEENLFEFNPNLEFISLNTNKISHIEPNVFAKLTKLKYLYLDSNPCINMYAINNPTEVQNVITTARAQCINSDYSNLEKKVKNLQIESMFLSSENFKEKLENLENEIKKSKFSNTFHRRMQDLKAAQVKKAQDTTTEAPKNPENSQFETCSALESKLTNIEIRLEENGENQKKIDENFKFLTEKVEKIEILNQKISSSDQKITEMDEKVSKLSKDMSTTLKDIESANNQNFAAIMKFMENLDKKIEEKLSEIDDAQKKLMNKIHKIESESHDDKVKINQKLRAILKAV